MGVSVSTHQETEVSFIQLIESSKVLTAPNKAISTSKINHLIISLLSKCKQCITDWYTKLQINIDQCATMVCYTTIIL